MTNQKSKTLYKYNEATKTAEWTVMKYDEVQMVVQMSPSGISFASANGAMGYSSCDQLKDIIKVYENCTIDGVDLFGEAA